MNIENELGYRKDMLDGIQEVIDFITKHKDKIDNIGVVFDSKNTNNTTDTYSSFVGNSNAIVGMYEKHKDRILNGGEEWKRI